MEEYLKIYRLSIDTLNAEINHIYNDNKKRTIPQNKYIMLAKLLLEEYHAAIKYQPYCSEPPTRGNLKFIENRHGEIAGMLSGLSLIKQIIDEQIF